METAKSSFGDIIKGDKPVLVDFFATWCGPCKLMPPILQDVKSQLGDRVTILKIDVDKNPAVANAYNVQSIPTMILFKKGEILWRGTGVTPAKQLMQTLAPHV
ncbi:MAG: thioredoxin [Filimonas sp.]|nr:thioredoxin [Filimonas sp.]